MDRGADMQNIKILTIAGFVKPKFSQKKRVSYAKLRQQQYVKAKRSIFKKHPDIPQRNVLQ